MEILEKVEEPLLSRIAVKASVVFEAATPSTEEVAKQIASALKKDEKLVVVKKIATTYGEKKADIDAVVYDSEEAKNKIERKTKAMKEAEKKAETQATKETGSAQEKPAEETAPAEEKKEEAPKEEKPAEEKKEEIPKEEKAE